MSQEPVFVLEDVHYGYAGLDVLAGLDLHIPAQKIVLVIGKNGSGKTTLFKLLSGLVRPDKGRIQTDVQPSRIGNLGHSTYIYPELTVLENLAFWARLYQRRMQTEALEEILDRVGLGGVMFEPAGHLSQGMAQRLSFARILTLAPKVMLLDEPTSGLDADSQTMMRAEVVKAKQGGASVLWITHSPRDELCLADYVLHLAKGRAVLEACREGQYQREGACSAKS